MTTRLHNSTLEEAKTPSLTHSLERGARLVFHYRPFLRQLTAVTEDLADILQELPRGVQMRNVVSIENSRTTFWMCFDNLGSGAQWPLLERFEAVGLDIRAARPEEVERLYTQFPQGEVAGRAMVDGQGHELIILKVADGWSVTQPGMTRHVMRWLRRTGRVAHLILTAVPDRTPGLVHFDLAFVLTVQPGNLGAAAELAQLLENDLDLDVQRYRGKSAFRLLNTLNPRSALSRRPQHSGCIGNIADLFPI